MGYQCFWKHPYISYQQLNPHSDKTQTENKPMYIPEPIETRGNTTEKFFLMGSCLPDMPVTSPLHGKSFLNSAGVFFTCTCGPFATPADDDATGALSSLGGSPSQVTFAFLFFSSLSISSLTSRSISFLFLMAFLCSDDLSLSTASLIRGLKCCFSSGSKLAKSWIVSSFATSLVCGWSYLVWST